MRTAQVSELKERLDEVIAAVKNGETVEIREGETAVADLVPPAPDSASSGAMPAADPLEAHLDKLVRDGKARRGTGELPDDFLTRPLPKAKKSVLDALLEDRRTD